MRYFCLVFFFICFLSCDYFDKKKIYTKDIVEEELRTFNWSEVDEFPTFESCKNRVTQEGRQTCFQTTLANHITGYLKDQLLVVTQDLNDTIIMRLSISEVGELNIVEIANTENVAIHIPEIDSLLIHSISNLPKVYPAIKRGQEVKTEFKLPIVIGVD